MTPARFYWLQTDDPLWDRQVKRCRCWHPFYLSGFMRAEVGFFGGAGKLLVYEEGGEVAVYPVLEQPWPTTDGSVYDLRGNLYAGPISSARDEDAHQSLASGLAAAMRSSSAANRWVTDFCRVNPFRPSRGDSYPIAQSTSPQVLILCRRGYSAVYGAYSAALKRNVRIADRFSLHFRHLSGDSEIDSLADLYGGAMRRVNASQRYCFDREYFRTLSAALGTHVNSCGVFLQDRLVSGGVRLVGNGFSFSYLQCKDAQGDSARPSHFYLNEAIRESCQQGLDYFVLGGGVPGQPGVMDFKRSFSADQIDVTYASNVLDRGRYAKLCLAAPAYTGDSSFFPPYRTQEEGVALG